MTVTYSAAWHPRTRLALAIFIVLPCCLGAAFSVLAPPPRDEIVDKWDMAAQHGKFNTAIVGDSRVVRVGGPAFSRRGWNYFNLAISGVSPEDEAMMLQRALLTQPIARVVMGLSFENMTETTPFEFSHGSRESLFQDPRIVNFVGAPPAISLAGLAENFLYRILPVARGHDTAHYIRMKMQGAVDPPVFLPDGEAAYVEMQERLPESRRAMLEAASPDRVLPRRSLSQAISLQGFFDPPNPKDPHLVFDSPQGDGGYQERGRLSPDSKRLFLKIIADLRQRGLPVVLFETGRSDLLEDMIEMNPVLHRLRAEWREFFRSQAGGCIRFVEQSSLHALYDQRDFVDALHYIGPTENRVSERLAGELASVEAECANNREKQ